MTGRLALLGVVLATMPLAVDLPAERDSLPGRTTLDAAGGGGQFAIVSRGCNGEVLHVTRNQLESGALVVEHRFPEQFVIGVRAGQVNTTLRTAVSVPTSVPPYSRDSTYETHYSNPYVNPYFGLEGPNAGIGFGWLKADHAFFMPSGNTGSYPASAGEFHRLDVTGHFYAGPPQGRLTVRWMEDVPLESEGHLTVDVGGRANRWIETGAFVGMLGPYDGTMIGLRGRVWITPAAALQIKASFAGNGQHGVYGQFTAGFRSPQ